MKDAGWKRSDLKLHNHGYYSLASAVLKQWKQDGRPRSDLEGITIWGELLKSHIQMQQKTYNCSIGI